MDAVELTPTSAQPRPANRSKGGRFAKGRRATINLTVVTRRQTPEEARRYIAAFDLLVSAIVRHELGPMGSNSHE